MPNHVTTLCTVTGRGADEVLKAHVHTRRDLHDVEHPHFDFNTVISMPAVLRGGTSPASYREGQRNVHETGFPDWYEWSICHWGTKWNSYQYKLIEESTDCVVFTFDTAWSPPSPIFRALATKYPHLIFDVSSKDEGGPEYSGRFHGEEDTFERKTEP